MIPESAPPQFEEWEIERTNRTLGVVVTNGADGYPHAVPVALHWEGAVLRFESDFDARKLRNIARDPHVSILFFGKPKWGVLIHGMAEIVSMGGPGEQAQIAVVPERKTSWRRKE